MISLADATEQTGPLQQLLVDFLHACSGMAPTTVVLSICIGIAAIVLGIKNGFAKKVVHISEKPTKWAWACVAVLWVVVMLNYFDRQLLAVLNQSITEGSDAINMTQSQFGTVTSAFLIVYAALSPVGGYLADRFSRKFIILMSLVVWSVVTYMTGMSSSFEELIFWRALMGVSEAFYIPAALALITDYHRGKTRSMATGLHMSGIYAGQIMAGYGAMMAGDPCQLGWRLTFETFGFIGVAYGLVVIFFLRDPEGDAVAAPAEEQKTEEPKPAAAEATFGVGEVIKSLFTGRAFIMLLVAYAIAGFANWFLMGWYPRLLIDMFGLSEAEAGPQATTWINFAKYGAVLLAAVAADAWYARTKNPNCRAFVPGIGFCLAGPCVVIAMLPALGLPIEFGLTATLTLVAMQGVAQGSLDATLMPVLRSQIDERFAATGYGMLNLTSVGAGALISWLGGYLKDANVGLGLPLSVAGMLMIVCGLIFFFLPRKKENA